MKLTTEQIEEFQTHGVLIAKNVWSCTGQIEIV
jgi:hypothetical protein